MELNFVTGNEGKFKEAVRIIPGLVQLDIDLTEIQEFDITEVIKAKLVEAFSITSKPCVVEDTGLYFDGMNGFPGPFIKWMLKNMGNDQIYQSLEKIGNTKAYSKCCVGYVDKNGNMHYFEGVVEGEIIKPKGDSSFGWNPIFMPNGSDKSFGEMSLEEKEMFSMRGQAFRKLKDFLDKNSG